MELKDLFEQKARLANEAQAILDKATTEQRDMTQDEETKFRAIHADIEKLNNQIEIRAKQAEVMASLDKVETRKTDPNPISKTETRAKGKDADLALRGWMLAASGEVPTEEMRSAALRMGVSVDGRRVLTFALPDQAPRNGEELRALSTSVASEGGATVPSELLRKLEEAQLFYGGMRQVADVIRTDGGYDLVLPTVNESNKKGSIVAQNVAILDNDDPAFGSITLKSFKYTSTIVRVPLELLQDTAVNLPAFLGRALGERIARATNEHFTVGTGTTQPWGLVTRATAHNLPSGTAGSFGASAAAAWANLVDFVHSVDIAYRRNGKFMMNDLVLAEIKSLVDGNGRPLWQPSLIAGQPDTFMGYPIVVNNDMVGTMANGTRSIVFGALDKYMIRDVRQIEVRRSDDRYFEHGQTAFVAIYRGDGDLLDAGVAPAKAAVHTT